MQVYLRLSSSTHLHSDSIPPKKEQTAEEDEIVELLEADDDAAEETLEKPFQMSCDEILDAYQRARDEIEEGVTKNLEREAVRQKVF